MNKKLHVSKKHILYKRLNETIVSTSRFFNIMKKTRSDFHN